MHFLWGYLHSIKSQILKPAVYEAQLTQSLMADPAVLELKDWGGEPHGVSDKGSGGGRPWAPRAQDSLPWKA